MPTLKFHDETIDDWSFLEGKNGKPSFNAFVNNEIVEAVEAGNFYSFTAIYDASDNETTLYFRNTDSNLQFKAVEISVTSKVQTFFTLALVSGDGSGTPVTGVNWNPSSGNIPNAVVFSDAGSIGISDTIDCMRVPDSGTKVFNLFSALVLSDGDALNVFATKGDEDTCVVLKGFYA